MLSSNYNILKNLTSSISVLLISITLLLSGISITNALILLKLKLNIVSNTNITILSCIYFFGMLLGTLKTSKLVKFVGCKKIFLILTTLFIIMLTILIITSHFYIFVICRLLQGFITSYLFIIIESYILGSFSSFLQGRLLALYMIVLYLSYSIGQIVLINLDIKSNLLFHIALIFIILSITFFSLFFIASININHSDLKINLKKMIKKLFLGLTGCFISGIFISTIMVIIPIYIQDIMENIKYTVIIMFILFLIGAIIQYPLGCLLDKINKYNMQVIFNTTFILLLLIFILLIYLSKSMFLYFIPIPIFIIGSLSFILYPINTNLVCYSLEKKDIMVGIETIMIGYGLGCMLGPFYVFFFIKMLGLIGYYISYFLLINLLFFMTTFFKKCFFDIKIN